MPKKIAPKKLITMRVSDDTLRKMDELEQHRQSTRSEVILIAIDKLYSLEIKQAQAHTEGKDNE